MVAIADTISDPSQPLDNPRWERFAQLRALGTNSQVADYQSCYPDASYEAACESASSLLRNPNLVDRIKAIQNLKVQKSVLSLTEKREFLAKVVRTCLKDVDESSELAQEVHYQPDGGKKIKMVGKLEALTLDARLAGELDKAPASTLSLRLEVVAANGANALPERQADAIEIEASTDQIED